MKGISHFLSGEEYVRKIELKLSKYLDVCNFFFSLYDEMCYGRNESIQMIGRFHYINGHSKSFVFHKHLFSFCRTIWKIYRWILIIRTCLEVNLYQSPMNEFSVLRRKFHVAMLHAERNPKEKHNSIGLFVFLVDKYSLFLNNSCWAMCDDIRPKIKVELFLSP